MTILKSKSVMPRAKKSLGQNFLIDKNYQQKILFAVSDVNKSGYIVEIGPGQGALSQHLIPIAKHYLAIEKDRDLAALLKTTLSKPHQVVEGDFLKIPLDFLGQSSQWIVVGNLPYNVASQIFIRLLEHRKFFCDLFLMFQKEMALRFVAKPGTKDYGLLTLWATIYTESKILFHLPPTVFRPQPKITSSFVHFKIKPEPLIQSKEETNFWPFVRNLFQHRRKTLASVLKTQRDKLPSALVKARAEDLSVPDLISLFRLLHELPPSSEI